MRVVVRPAFAEPSQPIAAMNMTPLIDVLLVLLVMMMLTVPIVTHTVPLDLPQPGPPPTGERHVHRLDLDRSGGLRLDATAIAASALPARLAAIRNGPSSELRVAVAPEVRYERFDATLATIKRAGITRLGFLDGARDRDF